MRPTNSKLLPAKYGAGACAGSIFEAAAVGRCRLFEPALPHQRIALPSVSLRIPRVAVDRAISEFDGARKVCGIGGDDRAKPVSVRECGQCRGIIWFQGHSAIEQVACLINRSFVQAVEEATRAGEALMGLH